MSSDRIIVQKSLTSWKPAVFEKVYQKVQNQNLDWNYPNLIQYRSKLTGHPTILSLFANNIFLKLYKGNSYN